MQMLIFRHFLRKWLSFCNPRVRSHKQRKLFDFEKNSIFSKHFLGSFLVVESEMLPHAADPRMFQFSIFHYVFYRFLKK